MSPEKGVNILKTRLSSWKEYETELCVDTSPAFSRRNESKLMKELKNVSVMIVLRGSSEKEREGKNENRSEG